MFMPLYSCYHARTVLFARVVWTVVVSQIEKAKEWPTRWSEEGMCVTVTVI